jgi:hypothetical protein
MTQAEPVESLFSRAESAFLAGDRRTCGILINQVLMRDFAYPRAWRLLRRLTGSNQRMKDFQLDFASKYFPERLHLLPAGAKDRQKAADKGGAPTTPVEAPAPGSLPLDRAPARAPEADMSASTPPSAPAQTGAPAPDVLPVEETPAPGPEPDRSAAPDPLPAPGQSEAESLPADGWQRPLAESGWPFSHHPLAEPTQPGPAELAPDSPPENDPEAPTRPLDE